MDPTPTRPAPPIAATPRARTLGAVALLLAGVGLLYGAGLGATDLWAPDEPRYAAIAEELRSMRHGARGLVLLHLNDAVYTQKPPLYFWLAALAGVPEGRVTELAARLPSALAGLASVGLTLWIARRLFARPSVALLAGGLLATSFRFVFTARRAQLDVLLTVLELLPLALFLWLDGTSGRAAPARRRALAIGALHASLGAATLVKGPVGWLPLAILAAFLAWTGRPGAMRGLVPTWAWGLSVGPLVLWAGAALALAPPGFAETAIWDNVFGRFFAGTSHVRPLYYFAYQLPLDFLPGSLLLPFALLWALRAGRQDTPATAPGVDTQAYAARFLTCWIVVPFVFFSLSAGKRSGYLLPIFPALAIACAIGTVSSHWLATRLSRPTRRLGLALAAIGIVEVLLFAGIAPWLLEPHKSPRPIARAVMRHADPGEPIGVYGMTAIEGALGYYADRPVRSIRDEGGLRRFVADGGRLVVLASRHLDGDAKGLGLREIEGFRSGRRRISLVTANHQFTPSGSAGLGTVIPPHPARARTEPAYAPALTPFSAPPALPGAPLSANLRAVQAPFAPHSLQARPQPSAALTRKADRKAGHRQAPLGRTRPTERAGLTWGQAP